MSFLSRALKVVTTPLRRARPIQPRYEDPFTLEVREKASRQIAPKGPQVGAVVRNGVWWPMIRPEAQVLLADTVWIVGAAIDRIIEECTKGGWAFEPKYAAKCNICDTEYDVEPDVCDTPGCGGTAFSSPDRKLLEPIEALFERPNWDDTTGRVIKTVNDLVRDIIFYMMTIDDYHWEVVFRQDGTPYQVWPVNSEFMRQVADPNLTVGPRFCPKCAEERGVKKAAYGKEYDECPYCGTELSITAWVQINETDEIVSYWSAEEILHSQARARGLRTYGRSKVLRAWAMAQIVRWQEIYQWSAYSGNKAPDSLVTVEGMDQPEVNKMVDEIEKFHEQHPSYKDILWAGLGSGLPEAGGGRNFEVHHVLGSLVDLDAVEFTKHCTEAIAINFGVSLVMLGKQEAGRLGQPDELLEVSFDTIEEVNTQAEEFVNGQLMPFYPEAVKQWVWVMNPPTPEDESKKADEAQKWVSVIQALRGVGYTEAKLDPGYEVDWPIEVGPLQPPQPAPIPGMEQAPGMGQSPPQAEPGVAPEPEASQPLPFPSSKAWVSYQGPQGGKGWRSTTSGEIRYQSEKPSEREAQAPRTPSTGAPSSGVTAPRSPAPPAPSAAPRPRKPVDLPKAADEVAAIWLERPLAHPEAFYQTAGVDLKMERQRFLEGTDPEAREAVQALNRTEVQWTGGGREELGPIREEVETGTSPMVKFSAFYQHFLSKVIQAAPAKLKELKKKYDPERYPPDYVNALTDLQTARTDHKIRIWRGAWVVQDAITEAVNAKKAKLLVKSADSWSFNLKVAASFASEHLGGGDVNPDPNKVPVMLEYEADVEDVLDGWPFAGFTNEDEIVLNGAAVREELEVVRYEERTWTDVLGEEYRPAVGPNVQVVHIRKAMSTSKALPWTVLLDLSGDDNDYRLWSNTRHRPQQKAWSRFHGPQGGEGWKSSRTGEVRYQTEMPSEREEGRPHLPTGRPPAELPAKPAPKEPGKVDLDTQPTADNLDGWMEVAMKDPRIAKFTQALANGEFSYLPYRREDGTYTPERQALHDSIVSSLLNPKAVAMEGKAPKVMFLLGQPAAGKTSVLSKYAEQLGRDWTTVNSDDVKKRLPEYEGWNAALMHEESSDIAEKELKVRAVQAKHNIIMDWTGANVDKVRREVEHFCEHGYDITLFYVDVPIEVSVFRAYKRLSIEGRYVPLDYIRGRIDKKPRKSYDELKSMGCVKRWAAFDNSGEAVKILDSGER